MAKEFIVPSLVKQQLPDFIREEYPKFVSFLEAYYEFLNINQLERNLSTLTDVDDSIDQFEQEFFNSFLPFIPTDVAVNKEFLIKNVLPLYLSKGSEKSYKLLFRLLFGEEVNIKYPGDNILRASDGRWVSEKTLKLRTTVYSEYISDGVKTVYYLPEIYDATDFFVYINDGLITSGYTFRREYQKIIFNVAPAANANIKIYYRNFDRKLITNRKVAGRDSGAYAIVERTNIRASGGLKFFELIINSKTYNGTFLNNEIIDTDIFFNDVSIPLALRTYSDIESITIVDPGTGYNIGDPVLVQGASERPAVALVDSVSTGVIEGLTILEQGQGFYPNANILAVGYDAVSFNAKISTVDTSGTAGPNTVFFNADIIANLENVILSNTTFGFTADPTANIEDVISTALSSTSLINLGRITAIKNVFSILSSTLYPEFDAESPKILNSTTRLKDLGIIATINIVSGGSGYEIGDNVIFTSVDFTGRGATAEVSNVSANGVITEIDITDGGLLYSNKKLPILSVQSANGANAILEVSTVFGDGESFEPIISTGEPGGITEIRILDSGQGYSNVPGVIMTGFGNGDAILTANLRQSIVDIPGRWTTTDSIISSDQRVLQGRDYFIDYSYLLISKVEFLEYKNILKNLLHPAGYIQYSRYLLEDELTYTITPNVESEIVRFTDFKANINASIYVVGFSDANISYQIGLGLEEGMYITINNQTRIVNSIVSNTEVTVSEAFSNTAIEQDLFITTTEYNAITTEISIELATEDDTIITTE